MILKLLMKKLIKTANHGNYILINFLVNEFNISDIQEIKRQVEKTLKKYKFPHVIFDLTNLNYIDSIGIGFFISTKNIFTEHQKSMTLVCNVEKILNSFESLNLNRFFPFFKTLDDAVKSLPQA
jgi:anti-anti-sigma factor